MSVRRAPEARTGRPERPAGASEVWATRGTRVGAAPEVGATLGRICGFPGAVWATRGGKSSWSFFAMGSAAGRLKM